MSERVRDTTTITDPRVMRAMAHPARLAIMEYLSSTGEPATATELAEVAGLSPSATSYHLRALARAGFIDEAPSRGDARERLWRTLAESYSLDAGRSADAETLAAEKVLIEAVLAKQDSRVRAWVGRARDESPEWYDAVMVVENLLAITAEELIEVVRRFDQLLEPYRRRTRTDPPEDARLVSVQFRSVPVD